MKTMLALPSLFVVACGGGSSSSKPDLAQPSGGDLAVHGADLATSTDLAGALTDLSAATDLATSSPDMTGAFLVVESCAQADYVDARTDASLRTITPWDTSLGKKCLRITAGQSVTWQGVPNASHPLEPHDSKSTSPNPITNQATNTFPNAGTYGFDCQFHHTLMHGAIWVDPT